MKTIRIALFLLFCTLLPLHSAAQDTPQGVARAVCRVLKTLDLTESAAVTQQKAIAAITRLVPGIDHVKILADYRKSHQVNGLSDEQVAEMIIADIAYELMRTCPEFLAVAMNGNKLFPQTPAELVPLGREVTALLVEKEKAGPLTMWGVNECIVAVAGKHKEMLTRRYGTNYMAPFNTEFRSYLFTQCEPYMKWSVAQAINQFKKMQNFQF